MASTLDPESSDRGSNPREAFSHGAIFRGPLAGLSARRCFTKCPTDSCSELSSKSSGLKGMRWQCFPKWSRHICKVNSAYSKITWHIPNAWLLVTTQHFMQFCKVHLAYSPNTLHIPNAWPLVTTQYLVQIWKVHFAYSKITWHIPNAGPSVTAQY